MALKHGNKSYYQVLIDPNRAELIEKQAEKEGIRGTAWVRKVAYEALQREFPSSEYKIAEAKDKLMWRESVHMKEYCVRYDAINKRINELENETRRNSIWKKIKVFAGKQKEKLSKIIARCRASWSRP